MMTITNRLKQIYGGMGAANVTELLRQIRERHPDGVVIVYDPKATLITVTSDTRDITACREATAQAVIANCTTRIVFGDKSGEPL
ncbi:MAG: hypothetical protein RSA68_18915 [Hafnia sp.]